MNCTVCATTVNTTMRGALVEVDERNQPLALHTPGRCQRLKARYNLIARIAERVQEERAEEETIEELEMGEA